MKNGMKRTALLVLSCASLVATVGYSSWIIESNKNYSLNNRDTVSKPVAYIVGNEKVKYTTIERALDVAQSGDIVCVIPPEKDNYHPTDNKEVPDSVKYEISRNCTIKEGVTLVLPTDKKTFSGVSNKTTLENYLISMREDDRSHGETTKNSYDYKNSYSKHATADEKNYLRVTVTIKEGVTLTNNGTIIVSGYLSGGASAGAGMRGQTSHSYSQILLGSKSAIVQSGSSASFHCYGFVKEVQKGNESNVTFESGSVYMPLIVNDYKGFQFLSGVQKAVKEQGCSPFNRLEMRNLMCNSTFKYGSSIFGITNIYYYQNAGSLGTFEDTLHNQFKILGNGTDALINLTNQTFSSLKCYFDSSSSKMKLNFIGGANIGNLAFKISASGVSIDLNTKYGYFPINYGMEIEMNKANGQASASFVSTSQKIKLLPGASMTLHEGCTLTGSELISLSAFVDGAQGQRDDIKWSAGTSYPLKEGATLCLETGASLVMDKCAGVIYSDDKTSITYNSDSIAIKEGWNQKQSGLQYITKDYLEMAEKAFVVPINYKSKKKMYIGMNRFIDPDNSSKSFIPILSVVSNDTEDKFDGNQGVVFFENDIENSKIKPISNINIIKQSIQNTNGIYPSLSNYLLGDISGKGNVIVCGINSAVSISSNNAGKNEFDVENITIKSLTSKVDGKDPLYIDGNIYLTAEVSNADQAYDKNVVWASLDESIATIDQTGKVTGKALGKVIFSATCGGKTAYYESEVIEDSTKIGVTDAWIIDSSGNSSKSTKDYGSDCDRPSGYGTDKYPTWKYSGEYKSNNGTTKFNLKYSPDNAVISKVVWSFSGTTKNYLLDYDGAKDADQKLDDDGSLSATVKWDGYTNAKPDGAVLKCTIEDITGNVTVVEFFILHNSGTSICIVEGTSIALSNGKSKFVEDLEQEDQILTFNHMTGQIVASKLFFNYHQNENNLVTAPILVLNYDKNISIGIHVEHGFFNYTKMKYVYVNVDNYVNFIGDEFIYLNSEGRLEKLRLISGMVKSKTVRVYSPVSEYHLDIFNNGLLSITGEIEGWFNYFDYDDGLRYDEEAMKRDIEKYGLYEYEDFKEYIRKEIFDLLPIPYLKVSVGKGLTTKAKIIEVMKKYLSFM